MTKKRSRKLRFNKTNVLIAIGIAGILSLAGLTFSSSLGLKALANVFGSITGTGKALEIAFSNGNHDILVPTNKKIEYNIHSPFSLTANLNIPSNVQGLVCNLTSSPIKNSSTKVPEAFQTISTTELQFNSTGLEESKKYRFSCDGTQIESKTTVSNGKKSVTNINKPFHTEDSLTVSIDSCGRNTKVTVSPKNQSGLPGTKLSYVLSTKNIDPSTCSPSFYKLVAVTSNLYYGVPGSNWKVATEGGLYYVPSSLGVLKPGESRTDRVDITSDPVSPAENHTIDFELYNTTNSTTVDFLAGKATATYKVLDSNHTAPSSSPTPSKSTSPSPKPSVRSTTSTPSPTSIKNTTSTSTKK